MAPGDVYLESDVAVTGHVAVLAAPAGQMPPVPIYQHAMPQEEQDAALSTQYHLDSSCYCRRTQHAGWRLPPIARWTRWSSRPWDRPGCTVSRASVRDMHTCLWIEQPTVETHFGHLWGSDPLPVSSRSSWGHAITCIHCLAEDRIGAFSSGGFGGPSPSTPSPAADNGDRGLAPPADDEHDSKWGTVRHLCGVAVYQEEEVHCLMDTVDRNRCHHEDVTGGH